MAGNSKKTIRCRLDAAGVDHVSEILQEWMAGAKVQPKNAIRSRLSMEGFLENLSAHFGGELDVSVEMGKKLGRTYFIVRYEGDAYDPIKAVKEDELTDQLMSYIGMMPTWSFKRGVNELILRLPRNKLRRLRSKTKRRDRPRLFLFGRLRQFAVICASFRSGIRLLLRSLLPV